MSNPRTAKKRKEKPSTPAPRPAGESTPKAGPSEAASLAETAFERARTRYTDSRPPADAPARRRLEWLAASAEILAAQYAPARDEQRDALQVLREHDPTDAETLWFYRSTAKSAGAQVIALNELLEQAYAEAVRHFAPKVMASFRPVKTPQGASADDPAAREAWLSLAEHARHAAAQAAPEAGGNGNKATATPTSLREYLKNRLPKDVTDKRLQSIKKAIEHKAADGRIQLPPPVAKVNKGQTPRYPPEDLDARWSDYQRVLTFLPALRE